jgi:hypothetical protein
VSPVDSGGIVDMSCSSLMGEEDSGAVMLMSDTRSEESSACSTTPLNTLYQEICDQKDVIMACLEEDKCDIDQVIIRDAPDIRPDNPAFF